MFSYPERGKFGAKVELVASGKQWNVTLHCNDFSGQCTGAWTLINNFNSTFPANYPNYIGMELAIDDGVPFFNPVYSEGQLPNGNYVPNMISYYAFNVDGSSHQIYGGPNAQSTGSTIDGAGIIYSATGTLISRAGVASASSTIEDSNGNIEHDSAGDDSIGRSALYSAFKNAQTITDSTGCSGPLPVVDVKLVNFPGLNGSTRQLKLCSVGIQGQTEFPTSYYDGLPITQGTFGGNLLQSVVLYNGITWTGSPAWTFEYSETNPQDGSNYLDLTQITFPTGGSVSYQWMTNTNSSECGYTTMSRWVQQRTASANDGSPDIVTTYQGDYAQMTVTDSQGNYVQHIFDSINNSGTCNYFEIETKWYDKATNRVLKSIQTDYSGMPDHFYPEGAPNLSVNVLPIRTTTTLANGMVTKIEKDYDSSNTIVYWDPYAQVCGADICNYGDDEYAPGFSRGLVTQEREYAYGNGAPGPLVRCTQYTYAALQNSQYLAANLLDLPTQVSVYSGACGSGTLISQTTNGYDETALQTSNVTTQHDTSLANPGVRGNLTSVHKWLNTGGTITTSTEYYDTGMPYQTTDGNGNTTTYTYSPAYAGGLLTQTQMPSTGSPAVQHMVNAGYDFNTGLMTSYTDQNNNSTSFAYDALSRMTGASFPDGGITSLTYPNFNTVVESVLQGKTTTTAFDGLGRKSSVTLSDPEGNDTTVSTYDSRGNLASVSNPYRSTSDPTYGITSYTYDALDRKTVQTQADGSTLSWSYDVSGTIGGAVTDSFDETGRHWRRTTDAFNNLLQVLEPDGSNNPTIETDYTYDALNNLTRIDQWGGASGSIGDRVRIFGYDSLSRLTSANNPESGTVTYAYDNNSNVQTKTDARGITTTYCPYDGLNRITCKSYSDGTPSVYFTYDQPAASLGTNTFGNYVGRLSQVYTVEGGSTLETYVSAGYDALGRPEESFECPGTSTCMTSGTLPILTSAVVYDLAGNIAGLGSGVIHGSSSMGEGTVYVRDTAARLSGILGEYSVNGSTVNTSTLFTATSTSPTAPAYTPLGGLANAQLSLNSQQVAAITLSRAYDNRGRITGETDLGGSAQIYKYTVGYAGNNNLTQFNDSLMASWSFGYDSLNRLQSGSTAGLSFNWTYDNLGNRLTQTPSGAGSSLAPAAQNLYYNTKNQVTSFSYDAAGNLTNDGTSLYLYDGEGRLCAVDHYQTPASLTGYVYDGLGRRVGKGNLASFSCNLLTNGFTATAGYVVGLDGTQLGETDGGFNLVHANVFAEGRLLATYKGSSWYYALNDWQGTKRVEANADGSVAASFLSLPFGDDLIQNGGPDATEQHFTGKEHDPESGNDYFGARYYGSATGRFLSPDWSATPQAMPYAELENPQSFNRYVYMNDNPLSGFDADGHDPCGIGVGSATGTVSRANASTSAYSQPCPTQSNRTENQAQQQKQGQKQSWWQSIRTSITSLSTAITKTYQTYTKSNPETGQVYSGRTSGVKSPADNVAARDQNHHMNENGYEPAQLDQSSANPYAIRGREQQLIDANGGAQSEGGTSGNAINGISPTNANRQNYMGAAESEFGGIPGESIDPMLQQEYLNNAAVAGGACGMSGDSPCE